MSISKIRKVNDDAVKDLVLLRMPAEEPLLEVGRIEAVVLGDLIAVRVDPFPTVDAGGDRIVFAMIMQLYPLMPIGWSRRAISTCGELYGRPDHWRIERQYPPRCIFSAMAFH